MLFAPELMLALHSEIEAERVVAPSTNALPLKYCHAVPDKNDIVGLALLVTANDDVITCVLPPDGAPAAGMLAPNAVTISPYR